ncbi:MAG TPA: hypothetical protein VJ756_11805 [Terriglobales bacterium]|nr:hypothetical protein [Terriglobales bacterium]
MMANLSAWYLASSGVDKLFSLVLWLAGVGHFCVLIASFQVPTRLHWNEDLKQLTPFNRKLMWVYGGFTVFTIAAFGVLTLALHSELLHGDRVALALALFIGVYWTLRIVVEFFYYDLADWPRGPSMVTSRILLTLLFVYLAGSNLALFLWKVFAL